MSNEGSKLEWEHRNEPKTCARKELLKSYHVY